MDMVALDQVNVIDRSPEEETFGSDSPSNVVSEAASEADLKMEEKSGEVSVPDMEESSAMAVPEGERLAAPPALVPSLIGKMSYEGGKVSCTGQWGMSDAAHGKVGQTSDFGFNLVTADPGSAAFPVDGQYEGWFSLKQGPPKSAAKIEDKEMVIQFTAKEEGGYTINGKGVNRFGSFTLRGSMSQDGDLHVYREYYQLAPAPLPVSKKRPSMGFAEPRKKKATPAKRTVSEDTDVAGGAVAPAVAAEASTSAATSASMGLASASREGAGRVRVKSSILRDYQDPNDKPAPPPQPVAKLAKAAAAAPPPAPAARRESNGIERAQRLAQPLKKCSELLKELSKAPQAVYFLAPVDSVRFNIPDYPRIITSPMDFGTAKAKLEGNAYPTEDAFAEDVRLVFRNAITFNTLRDNPVHIAARDLSTRFESLYRTLKAHLSDASAFSAGMLALDKPERLSVGGGGKRGRPGRPPAAAGRAPAPHPAKGAKFARGPVRSASFTAPALMSAPVVVENTAEMLEMRRMMQSMQAEIQNLRSAVSESEVMKRVEETAQAAANPLTFEEKKSLIAQIHKLPSELMEQVLEIIQAALPPSTGDDAEIEVPLDALDTFTLRKLQRFVDEHNKSKKAVKGAPKKRKSAVPGGMGMGGDLSLYGNDEDALLFEADCFEDLKAQAHQGSSMYDQ